MLSLTHIHDTHGSISKRDIETLDQNRDPETKWEGSKKARRWRKKSSFTFPFAKKFFFWQSYTVFCDMFQPSFLTIILGIIKS